MTQRQGSFASRRAVVTIADLLEQAAQLVPEKTALIEGEGSMTYRAFDAEVKAAAAGFELCGVKPGERVAIYLEKSIIFAVAFVAAMRVGAIVIPINPLLKTEQLSQLISDSQPALLLTTEMRLMRFDEKLVSRLTVVIDESKSQNTSHLTWTRLLTRDQSPSYYSSTDSDPAAILYTSGSTGAPKGVVLSHRNLTAGAQSVTAYLKISENDRLLGLLPMSFDAGLSQLTCAIAARAQLILMTFLTADGVVSVCSRYRPTVITGVPPLWHQLVSASWPAGAASSVRIIANTGGHMPTSLLGRLQSIFSCSTPYLMYGLTEAFRSTCLDPKELARRPNSIGKSVPNALVQILREDGSECEPGEVGELVHRGAFVALGYWRAPDETARRFRPVYQKENAHLRPEFAVWSGDLAKKDAEGFIYFIGRKDAMIKTCGYRVSPTEIEKILLEKEGVEGAIVFTKPHPTKEQIIVAVVACPQNLLSSDAVRKHCAERLPSYMVPSEIILEEKFPHNVNGKIDRVQIIDSVTSTLDTVSVV